MHPAPIGPAGMVGVGPGQNLHHKTFDGLKKDFIVVLEHLKKQPQPEKASIKGYLHQLEAVKKDVGLYCAVPGTDDYQACYDRAIAILKTLEKHTDQAKLDAASKAEVPKLMRQLMVLTKSDYVEPKAAPAPASAGPARPAAAAPAAPPRPNSPAPTARP